MRITNSLKFKEISFPGVVEKAWLPDDLILKLPEKSNLPKNQQHFLLYIPWDDKYLELIPGVYRNFFKMVFSYLNVRTVNVHTAISLSFLNELISNSPNTKINKRIITIAFILHDSGWSELNEKEIASSLGISGLKLTKNAIDPKEKHAIEGVKVAKKILRKYKFLPPLTSRELEQIEEIILYHDKPEKVTKRGSTAPIELQIAIDLDHIWSFTHENFWQDTLRKEVLPIEYANNLKNDLDSYFITDQGIALAKKLLKYRSKEVKVLYDQYINN